MLSGDLELPVDLGRRAAEIIVRYMAETGLTYTGGCKAFYTPHQWRERGEEYGTESLLIVCHDGGDLAAMLNWDYFHGKEDYERFEELQRRLGLEGMYIEGCTCWYSAVYPT